jgi:hypothetical protein
MEPPSEKQSVSVRRCTAPRLSQPTNHQTRPIMPRHSHNTTRHILITPRNRNISIMELCTGHSLDTIRNDLSCLQTEPHPLSAHRNAIAYANGVVLPRQHLLLLDRPLDFFTDIQQVGVARVSFPPDACNADLRVVLEDVFVRHAGGVEHCLGGGEVMLAGQGGGVFVEATAWFRVGEVEVARLFGDALLLEVGGIHGGSCCCML